MNTKTNISRRDRIGFALFISMLIGFAVVGVLTVLSEDREKSALENRELASFETVKKEKVGSAKYFRSLETYFNDQLVIRDSYIQLDGMIKQELFRQNIIDNVYIDKNGAMYQAIPESEGIVEDASNKINHLGKELEKIDTDLYLAIAPNKSTFYEKNMPSYMADVTFGRKFMDALINEIDPSVKVIDLRETMKDVDKKYKPYFDTDHHWTIEGAFAAYGKVLDTINENGGRYSKPLSRDDYTQKVFDKYPFYGTYARRISYGGSDRDFITVFELKKQGNFRIVQEENVYTTFNHREQLESPSKYSNRYGVYGNDYPEIVVDNLNNQDGKKILLIKDSYANPMIQFFAQHVSTLYVLDPRYYKDMSVNDYVKKHDIDDVIILQNNNRLATPDSNGYFLLR